MNEEGTRGAETIVTIEFEQQNGGTHVRVSHAGLPDEDCAQGHGQAWQGVLKHWETTCRPTPDRSRGVPRRTALAAEGG